MAVHKEDICLSRVYSYYYKCNLPLFYVLTLLACTHSSDNLFHSQMVLCENENVLTSNLRCFFTRATLCPLHCAESFVLAFIDTPKSFSVTVLLRIVPHISQFMPVFPGPVCRHLHFPKCNNICPFSDHLTNLAMPSCNFCLPPISLVFLQISIHCLLPLPLNHLLLPKIK